MRHALGFRNFSAALYFFHEWPDLAHAAQLVLDRASEIDGNAYSMARNRPATSMPPGTFSSASPLRSMIPDYGTFETDEAFTSRLRASHARKTGFWKQIAEVSGTRS